MEGEKVYFDEEVKGHRLLVTPDLILFKGKTIDTPAVDTISAAVFRQSVNAIPSASSYTVSIASQCDTITVQCARVLWLGRSQYERLRRAISEAIGHRLIRDSLRKLLAGEALIFDHKGRLFERNSLFTLSRFGIQIEQEGVISRRKITIEWRHLRMQTANGVCILRCYSIGKKASFQLWHMSNDIVLGGVLNFLLDKANYRLLDARNS